MSKGRIIVFAAVAVSGMLLGGCREEEQGRILDLQRGAYKGAPDTSLSEDAVRALHERARYQHR